MNGQKTVRALVCKNILIHRLHQTNKKNSIPGKKSKPIFNKVLRKINGVNIIVLKMQLSHLFVMGLTHMVQELKLPQLEEEEKRECKATLVKMQKKTLNVIKLASYVRWVLNV